jgi:hypothetical protein
MVIMIIGGIIELFSIMENIIPNSENRTYNTRRNKYVFSTETNE